MRVIFFTVKLIDCHQCYYSEHWGMQADYDNFLTPPVDKDIFKDDGTVFM